jgi:uncharacterized protein
MPFKIKLLSIDGGGIRGVIPAMLMADIERRTKRPIAELFDFVAGTSTGGILALGITKRHGSKPNVPQYSAESLVALYEDEGTKIFSEQETLKDKILEASYNQVRRVFEEMPDSLHLPAVDLSSLRGPKYTDTGKLEVLKRYLGDDPIENSLQEVFVTSYDTEERIPIFFTSNTKAEDRDNPDFRKLCSHISLIEAAMATSAAPTFFPPYKLNTIHSDSGHYSLVDGGIFANNPTSLAIMEAMISYKKRTNEDVSLQDILVVSLGTGSLKRRYNFDTIKDWGLLSWVQPLLNIVMDSLSESVTCQLDQLLPKTGDQQQYYRFQGPLQVANDDMDDTTPENMQRLKELANLIVEESEELLAQLSQKLLDECMDK